MRGDSKVDLNESPEIPDEGVCGGGGGDIRHPQPLFGDHV